MRRLVPTEAAFFDDFERQARLGLAAAQRLRGLVHDFTGAPAVLAVIRDLGHDGDRVTHDIFHRLHTTFVTPLDREDIHALAGRLDDVLDEIDEAAAQIVVYRVKEPTSECRTMATLVADAVAAMDRAVGCLRRSDPALAEHLIEVHRQENRADDVLRRSVAALFMEHADPIEVLKWKDIYETMERATDRCEDVANVLESIMFKMR